VYFPRVSEDGLIGNEGPRASSRQVLEGLTVLLVEDDGEIREIIRDTLEENGCNVVEAENGLTALERCAAHDGPIQLLVTDMMMPGMNGHELAERIVRMRPETPVLFVSGHPEAEVGDNTLIGRRVSLLRKPFSSDELVERVAEVVRSSDPGSLVEG
jgi:two-component system cell cycle sensor histidine kinase/response regulator CckA